MGAAKKKAGAKAAEHVGGKAPAKRVVVGKCEEALATAKRASSPDDYRETANALYRAYNQARRKWKIEEAAAASKSRAA